MIESVQAGRALFALGKSVLAVPSQLPVLPVFGDALKEDFLYNFRRDQAGADQPLAPQILLLALLEDRCDICLLAVIGNLSVTNDREWPGSDIDQLASLPRHLPSGPMDLFRAS